MALLAGKGLAAKGLPSRRPVRRRVASSEHVTGWAFVTPAALIIGLFGAAPIVWSAVMSFQKKNLLTPDTPFVGTANYRQMIHDPVVAQAIQHTLIYTALFVPGTMVVGLFLAVAMNRKIRFIWFYRTAAYATVAISTISEAIVFIWLFDPSYGVVNYFLGTIGVPPQQFINSPSQALYVIVIMTIWGWTGFAVVIYLAALQGVPQHLTEAAAIDGAGPWQAFRRVTLPLLSPASLFLTVWLTINALQLFDEVYLSTQGGPLNATTVLVYYLYNQAFQQFNFGYASAIAYFLFLVIIVITVIPVPGRPTAHVLPLMTATSAPARGGVRSPAGGGVRRARRRWRLPFSPWHLVLVPATIVLLFPFAWLLATSVETQAEALHFPPVLIPHQLRLANYPDALNSAPFGRFFVNSAIVAVVTVLSNLVLCSLAGYAFARFRFLGRTALFAVIMATLMVPFQVTMIPQFIITKWLGVHVLAAVGINHIGASSCPTRPPRSASSSSASSPHAAAGVRGIGPGGRGQQAHRAGQDRAAAGRAGAGHASRADVP